MLEVRSMCDKWGLALDVEAPTGSIHRLPEMQLKILVEIERRPRERHSAIASVTASKAGRV
jgi:hypothetical protein